MIGRFFVSSFWEKRVALTSPKSYGFAVFSHKLIKLENGFVWCHIQILSRFMRFLWNSIARTLNLVKNRAHAIELGRATQAIGQKKVSA